MRSTRFHTFATNPSLFKATRRKLYLAMLAASQLMVAGQLWASPEGGEVVGGEGSIETSGTETTIHQATERMAIDWKSFDVKADERVQFIQPKSTSVALNRVLSHKGSEILGRIDANGQVILINPNGIVFGKDSQINVGGMIASGLSIDPNDFMNGEFTLTAIEGTEGKVINTGIINAATGGSVTLLGKEVKNEGLISAHLGSVNLAAGKAAVVTFDASGLVGVKITQAVLQNDLGLDAAVINSGDINAQGGKILITASVSQDIFSQAVNNGGMNQKNSVVVNEDGTFTLGAGADVKNSGTISTSNTNTNGDAGQIVLIGNNISNSGNILADTYSGAAGHVELHSVDTTELTQTTNISAQAINSGVGGDVKILGNKVGLFDTANVNASGANGGGQVLVGGDKTGQNKNIRNADFIYLGENSNVKTDALLNGDGGKLITFASDTARIYGNLSARGGSEGGNGGFIETSGLSGFEIWNAPDVSALNSAAGSWLIDPYNLTIKDDSNSTISGTYTANGNNSVLSRNILGAALINGANVTVSTSSNGSQEGNITLFDALTYNSGTGSASLTLSAANNIIIKNNITRSGGTGFLNVSLNANTNTANDDVNNITTTLGRITFDSGTKIETKGGDFTATGFGFNSEGATVDTSSGDNSGGGDIDITSTGMVAAGDITLGILKFGYVALNGNNVDGPTARIGSALITSGNDVFFNGGLDFQLTGNFNGALPTNESTASFLTINAKNNITIDANITDSGKANNRDTLAVTLNANSDGMNGGNIAITAGSTIETRGGAFTATGVNFTTAVSTTTAISTGNVLFNAGTAATNYDDPSRVGGNVLLNMTGAVTLQSAIDTSGGDFTVGTFTNGVPVNRAASFNNHFTNGLIKTYNAFGGGNIAIATTGAVNLGSIDFGYNYRVTDTGDTATTNPPITNPGDRLLITTANQLKRIGSVTINAGTDVTLHNDINFNDTGRRNTAGVKGYQGALLDGQENALTITAGNNITVNERIYDQYGDARDALNITLIAGDTLDVKKSVYTSGGNFSAQANNFISAGALLDTDNANDGSVAAIQNEADWSNGGNITISAGNIILGGTVTGPRNLSLTGNIISVAGAINTHSTLVGAFTPKLAHKTIFPLSLCA
jgi:filamentous hemagglutinin family protein